MIDDDLYQLSIIINECWLSSTMINDDDWLLMTIDCEFWLWSDHLTDGQMKGQR